MSERGCKVNEDWSHIGKDLLRAYDRMQEAKKRVFYTSSIVSLLNFV